jgi:hypothetical protein
MVEAARERVADATGCLDRPQCEGACHCRNAAIAALTAALAVAVAEGVVLCKVPEERRFLWRVTFADPR